MFTLLLCLWPILQLIYNKSGNQFINLKDKITRNKVAFSNALGTLILGTSYCYTGSETLFKLTILYPTSYYIFDTYLILNKKYYAEYPYIYHHLITIYLLENLFFADSLQRALLLNILISAELSNLPIYPVYHIIKTGDKDNIGFYDKLISWKKFQIIWYLIIRVFYFSYVIYHKYYSIDGFFLRNLSFTIYILGIYWLYGQVTSLKNDIKKRKSLQSNIKKD